MNAKMLCPNCGLGAAPYGDTNPNAHDRLLYCRCSWEQIALAYRAKGEDKLAALAAHIAAYHRGELEP